jgi:drug/metabolite transporter (DMT)-like permease
MAWLPLALAVPAILTIVNFIDKYMVEREVPDQKAMVIFAGGVGFLAALAMWLFGAIDPIPQSDALLLVASGIMVIIGALFYFRAVSMEQTSTVIIVFQVMPVFVLILGWIIFRETITVQQFIGFWLILGACFAISLQPDAGRLRPSPAFWLMVLVALLVAIRSLAIAQLPTPPPLGSVVFYQGIGQGIGAVLIYALFPPYRRALNRSVMEMRKWALGILLVSESMFLASEALRNQALTLGPPALVNVVGGVQTFYAILVGWLLTTIAPTIFRESITRRDLVRKAFLSVILFIGLALVVLSGA